SDSVFGFFGLTMMPTTAALGDSSRSTCSRFGPSMLLKNTTPVRLQPGRLRLGTIPALTGSVPAVNTIGIVVVAALAAVTDDIPPVATITDTRRSTSWDTSVGRRS